MANRNRSIKEDEDIELQETEDEEGDVEELERSNSNIAADEDEEEQEEEELEEESEGAATLHAGSKNFADPKSKIEVMKSVLGAIAAAGPEDLTKWFHQTIEISKHKSDAIPDGRSEQNKDTIHAHPSDAVKESVKQDLKALFDSDKTLTEEAKERLETIFEAAVAARVMIEREEMEASYADEVNETINEVKEDIEKQLSEYLNYCAGTWMEQNEVAVESALRTQLTEEFMSSLKQLFAEHFIHFPEEKTEVIDALSEQIEEYEEVLNKVIEENNELKGYNLQSQLEGAIEEVAEGLTVSQVEKLATLSEGIEFDGDMDTFKKKVNILKETYFGANGSKPASKEEDDFEKTDNELNEEGAVVINDPLMKKYAQTIKYTAQEDLRSK